MPTATRWWLGSNPARADISVEKGIKKFFHRRGSFEDALCDLCEGITIFEFFILSIELSKVIQRYIVTINWC